MRRERESEKSNTEQSRAEQGEREESNAEERRDRDRQRRGAQNKSLKRPTQSSVREETARGGFWNRDSSSCAHRVWVKGLWKRILFLTVSCTMKGS